MELRDKVVVITGGSGGIGKAMAAAFLREGAKAVMLADLNADAVAEAAAELGCDGMACNVTDEDQLLPWRMQQLPSMVRLTYFARMLEPVARACSPMPKTMFGNSSGNCTSCLIYMQPGQCFPP